MLAVFLLLPSCGVQAQKDLGEWPHLPWHPPGAYSEAPHFEEFFERCSEEQDWGRASLLTTLDGNHLISILALREQDSLSFFLVCNGDMRWVAHSSSPHENLSRSLVQGYNGGALDVVVGGFLHSLGGYGLWRRHFELLRFHGGGQAWQLVATEGQAPAEGDTDRSLLHPSGDVAFVLRDNKTGDLRYGEDRFLLYSMDIKSREWTRHGRVDARSGVMQLPVHLGAGMLAANKAGELVFVDFESFEVRVLPSAAGIVKAFHGWEVQSGRMTFVSDSSAWHEYQGVRYDLDIPWEALAEVSSVPLVDAEMRDSEPLDETSFDSTGDPEPRLPWLPWSLVVMLTAILVAGRAQKGKRGVQVKAVASGGNAQERLSDLATQILSHGSKQYETEELDDLLGISHLSSPETLRSQRARLISKVNTEYRMLSGFDLIVRKQSPLDRRRSIYVIQTEAGDK